MLLHYIIF